MNGHVRSTAGTHISVTFLTYGYHITEADVSCFLSAQVQGTIASPPKLKSIRPPAKSVCARSSASPNHRTLSVLVVAVLFLLFLPKSQHWLHAIRKTCSLDETSTCVRQQTHWCKSTGQQQQDEVGLMEMISLEKRTSMGPDLNK